MLNPSSKRPNSLMRGLKSAASKQASAAHISGKGNRLNGVANPPEEKRWTFSLRFFRQREYFGLDCTRSDKVWFVSLIERLAVMGGMTIDEIISDPAKSQDFRFHPINWAATNIPISREALDWLPEHYLKSAADYPIRQFAISKSLGRIVGFFDENSVFQIVLLDPLHNIQPSKAFDYMVNPCDPMDCEITQLRASIESVLNSAPVCECEVAKRVRENMDRKTREYLPPILLMPVDEQTFKDAQYLLAEHDVNSSDILNAGLYALLEKADAEAKALAAG